jgi:dolichol-phosphate mannosyltransferase
MNAPDMLLSVIVPCYNEERVLEATYSRIRSVLDSKSINWELIFINDGSTDRSPQILDDLASRDPKVFILHFSRNFGHQPAVSAGLHECKGSYAIILDADLQDPPECIPEMLQLAQEQKAEVIYGVRRQRAGESLFKKLSAKLYYRTIHSLSEVPLPLDTGDFRLISRRVIDEFCALREKNKYIRGLISWVGFKQLPFAYDRDSRYAGNSHYSLSKMIGFATRGITYFSKKPLLMATNLGLFCVLVGLGLVVYVFVSKYYFHQVVSGWASLLITIVFFGGIQLLSIGLLGQYLGSIFDEVKDRPEYIIHRKINFREIDQKENSV